MFFTFKFSHKCNFTKKKCEKECLYFQWKFNVKCFKYMVEDRPRKNDVYGIAYCLEPRPHASILKTLIHYSRS